MISIHNFPGASTKNFYDRVILRDREIYGKLFTSKIKIFRIRKKSIFKNPNFQKAHLTKSRVVELFSWVELIRVINEMSWVIFRLSKKSNSLFENLGKKFLHPEKFMIDFKNSQNL